jgi:hypothetical protein
VKNRRVKSPASPLHAGVEDQPHALGSTAVRPYRSADCLRRFRPASRPSSLRLLAVVNERRWTKGPTRDVREPINEVSHLRPDGLVEIGHFKEEQCLLGMPWRDCSNHIAVLLTFPPRLALSALRDHAAAPVVATRTWVLISAYVTGPIIELATRTMAAGPAFESRQ